MNELKTELQELQNLDQSTLDEAQQARLANLPSLILAEAEKTAADKSKIAETALAQKEHFRTKFEKEETERKALEEKLKGNPGATKPALDVEDYIDISASLEGLDQREKEYLAKEHKLTGKPLKEIRENEDFTLWQSAYRQKVEKEKQSLPPTGTQPDAPKSVSFDEKLANATMEEKEKLLIEAGLYKAPRAKTDRVNIGTQR